LARKFVLSFQWALTLDLNFRPNFRSTKRRFSST